MGIRDRVEDSDVLLQLGRPEGALLCLLTAVAATSRLRFPDRRIVRDRAAFTQFLGSHHLHFSVIFRGQTQSIEDTLYEWVRCALVHEGGLPVDVQFTPEPLLGVSLSGTPSPILKLTHGWFAFLKKAVVTAPENRVIFAT